MKCELYSLRSKWGQVAGCYESGNEHSGSTETLKLPYFSRNYQLLKKGPTSWSGQSVTFGLWFWNIVQNRMRQNTSINSVKNSAMPVTVWSRIFCLRQYEQLRASLNTLIAIMSAILVKQRDVRGLIPNEEKWSYKNQQAIRQHTIYCTECQRLHVSAILTATIVLRRRKSKRSHNPMFH